MAPPIPPPSFDCRFGFVHEDSRIVRAIFILMDKICQLASNPTPPKSYYKYEYDEITTNSATFTEMTNASGNMSITPPAGTYLVSFSGNVRAEGDDQIGVALLKNGLAVSDGASERNIYLAKGEETLSTCFHTQLILTLNGADIISGCWKFTSDEPPNGNLGHAKNRSLVLLAVTPSP